MTRVLKAEPGAGEGAGHRAGQGPCSQAGPATAASLEASPAQVRPVTAPAPARRAAPPRFSVPGMTDILVTHDILGAAHPRGATGLVNLYAAMPSLHVAWAAWCAAAVVTTTRGRWRHLAWLYPAVTTLVVLASANHFVLDAAGGFAVTGLGMLTASRPVLTFSRGRRGTEQPTMVGGLWMAVDGLAAAAAIGLYTTAWRRFVPRRGSAAWHR